MGNPHIDDGTNTSFNSQITCVLKVPGKDLYIACADRWKPGKTAMKMSRQVISGMEKRFKDYQPDRSPKEAAPLSGKKQRNWDNTRKADYVWLPIEWQGEKPMIRWMDEWRIEDYPDEN